MRERFSVFFICLLFLSICSAEQAPQIQVAALFKNKALIYVNGKKYMLERGERSPEGIILVSANASRALFEFNGQRFDIAPSVVSSRGFKENKVKAARIHRGTDGMYKAVGTVNGQTANFLVDTGASIIAMSNAIADRLGVQYHHAEKQMVKTAGGFKPAYFVVLDSVKIGEIELRMVRAAVITSENTDNNDNILLGMSFLSQVNINDNGQFMLLEQAF